LNYHFGSRDGLLAAILEHHGDPTDAARRIQLEAVGRHASSRDLVAALVIPYAAHLGTPDGRTTFASSLSCPAASPPMA